MPLQVHVSDVYLGAEEGSCLELETVIQDSWASIACIPGDLTVSPEHLS